MPAKSNSTPAERLKIVIENAGMSTYALSRHIGFQRPENLYQILRGKCGISKNMANIIHQKFPRYSIDWLIYGDNDSQETLHFITIMKRFYSRRFFQRTKYLYFLRLLPQMRR